MATQRASVLFTVAGVLVWAVHFMASYGLVTIICTRGLGFLQWGGIGVVAWTMITLTVAALIALAALAFATARGAGFGDRLAAGVAALAALAVVWESWLVLREPPCA